MDPLINTDGESIQTDDGWLLPHYRTFSAIFNAVNQTYSYRYDEALKHLPENALAMRRDAFVMALLRERQMQVAQLKGHVEPEDESDPQQVALAARLTKLVKRTPRWHHFTMALVEALWYGRYGVQIRTDRAWVAGRPCTVIADHKPVNGDKIQWGWDGVPRVYVNAGEMLASDPRAEIIYTERAPALVLRQPYYRSRFVIHRHEIDDADYLEGEKAGGIGGVGLRDRIYWCWWLRDEMLGWAVNFMKKVGTLGLLLFYYDENNPKSKTAAQDAARDAGTNFALAVPRPRGDSRQTAGAEMLPANPGGVTALQSIIADYFEVHMERLVIGQTLSGRAQSTGLGSSVADLHADTKFRILRFDADNLDGTLTEDLVKPMVQWNEPAAAHVGFRWVSDVPSPDSKDKLDAAGKVVSLGIPCKQDEIRNLAGLSRPEPDDAVTGQPNSVESMALGGQTQPMSLPSKGSDGQPALVSAMASSPGISLGYVKEDAAGHLHGDDGRFTSGSGGRGAGEERPHVSAWHKLWSWARDADWPYDQITAGIADLEELGKRELLEVAEAAGYVGGQRKNAAALRKALGQMVLDRRSSATRAQMILNPNFEGGEIDDDGYTGPFYGPEGYAAPAVRYDAGRWVTIGGKVGDDGKKKGGSPVFIKDGRIVKGHPSLTGHTVASLKDGSSAAKEGTTRQQLNQSKNYQIAKIVKEARQDLGVSSKAVHDLAEDIKKHDREFVRSKKEFLAAVRQALDVHGGSHRILSAVKDQGKIDSTMIRGLDVVAQEYAEMYPEFLDANQDGQQHAERLFEMLIEGNPEPMSDEDVYQQAVDQLAAHVEAMGGKDQYLKQQRASGRDRGIDGDGDGDGDGGDTSFDFGFNEQTPPSDQSSLDLATTLPAASNNPAAEAPSGAASSQQPGAYPPKPATARLEKSLSGSARAVRNRIKSQLGLEPWQVTEGEYYGAIDPAGDRQRVGMDDSRDRLAIIEAALIHTPDTIPNAVLFEIADKSNAAMNELMDRNRTGRNVPMPSKGTP